MKPAQRIADWLETHWITPAYSGWLLAVIALCFFGAATNTMAGWLYVLSGIIFALLGVNGWGTWRALRHIQVRRLPIAPVSAGDDLTIKLEIENPTQEPKNQLEIWDLVPYVLSNLQGEPIEVILPHTSYQWSYYLPTQRRGIYQWETVQLRSGKPFGLFWCRRSHSANARAVVYPQVLTLLQCPLVDTIGREQSDRLQSTNRYQSASEGVTRALRPYRYGDSMRLIHWRTSARLGEFKVRELEIITGGQDVIICLDSAIDWDGEDFERAVIVAASLYFYASRSQMNVKLWTAGSGLVYGNRVVLETLAGVESQEDNHTQEIPNLPLIWLTQNASTLENLPFGSRWVFFPVEASSEIPKMLHTNALGLIINRDEPLEKQLQRPFSGVTKG